MYLWALVVLLAHNNVSHVACHSLVNLVIHTCISLKIGPWIWGGVESLRRYVCRIQSVCARFKTAFKSRFLVIALMLGALHKSIVWGINTIRVDVLNHVSCVLAARIALTCKALFWLRSDLAFYVPSLGLFNLVNVNLVEHVDSASQFVSLHFRFVLKATFSARRHRSLLNF